MRKILFIAFLISVTSLSYSQIPDVSGAWMLERIEVTLIMDGKTVETTYTKDQVFKTPTVCVEKLNFTSENELSVLFKGYEESESAPYNISDDTLIWEHPTGAYKYSMRFIDGRLVMSSEGIYAIDGVIGQYKYVHYLTKGN